MSGEPDFQAVTVAGVPCLLAAPPGAQRPLPVVLWFHGFGVDKETHRPELARLAGAGYLAVGTDAVAHGERREEEVQRRVRDAPREQALPILADLAARTAAEVPAVVDALVRDHGADAGRVALAGVSMGGYVVYGAAVLEPRTRAAVSILGSPEWPHPRSPHAELGAFARVALLSIVGELDENVPPAAARALHGALRDRHPAASQRFVELAGAPHLMGEADWERIMAETLAWLRRFTR